MMKKTKRQPRLKVADMKYLGAEPIELNSASDLICAFNWYNYFHDVKSGRPWLEEYCKANGLTLRNTREITITMCAVARMCNRGLQVPKDTISRLHKKIKDKVKPQRAIITKIASVRFPLYKFEDLLDTFYEGNYKFFEPKAYELLRSLDAKPSDAKAVASYYKPLLDELEEAGEGYEHLKRKKLADYVKFVSEIINEAEKFGGNAKVVKERKPRKRKEVSAAKLVKWIKYKKQDDELKLASISPEKIIGAKTVWLYNTKYKKLIKVVGDSLSIKGTTIKDNNPELTVCKTLRKPEEQLAGFMQGTDKRRAKFFNDIKTKESTTNSRLNEFTIILKVY